MINTLGGAGTFLSLSPTLIRRFLLEQMVCIDVFGEFFSWPWNALQTTRPMLTYPFVVPGSFFTIDAPLIFEPRSAWWASPFSESTSWGKAGLVPI